MSDDDWPEDSVTPHLSDQETRRQLDDTLDTLANRRRRNLLYYLIAIEVTDIETLAINMASVYEGISTTDVSSTLQEQVHLELVHQHLPKLDDLGLVEFDRRSGAVRCRDFPPMAKQCLELCRTLEVKE